MAIDIMTQNPFLLDDETFKRETSGWDPGYAVQAAERWGQSARQVTNKWNSAYGTDYTPEQGANMMGQSSPDYTFGKAYQTQDPRTGQFSTQPTDPTNFSGWKPGTTASGKPLNSPVNDPPKVVTDPNSLSLSTVAPYVPGSSYGGGGTVTGSGILAAAGYNSPEAYRPAYADTVAGQLDGLLAKNSPYIQAAEERAKRQAHARGLQNSSLAGEYGAKAAIESALPIAQQDSGVITQAGLNRQQGQIQGALNTQNYGNEARIINLQTENSSKLSNQEYNQNLGILNRQGEQNMDLQRLKGTQDIDIATLNQNAETTRFNTEQTVKMQIANSDLSSNEVRQLGNSVTVLGQQLSSDVATIRGRADLSPESKDIIVAELQSGYRANVANLTRIYGVELSWE